MILHFIGDGILFFVVAFELFWLSTSSIAYYMERYSIPPATVEAFAIQAPKYLNWWYGTGIAVNKLTAPPKLLILQISRIGFALIGSIGIYIFSKALLNGENVAEKVNAAFWLFWTLIVFTIAWRAGSGLRKLHS